MRRTKTSLRILLSVSLINAASCKSLEEKLSDINRFCIYQPSTSSKAICYKYRYWVKDGEVLSQASEIELPETIYFVDSDDLARLLQDRDRAAIFRETHDCKVKRRR